MKVNKYSQLLNFEITNKRIKMKNMIKMSLVAAVAVAGLTNVNAASLEEAIKGVDVSGQFRFRAEEKNDAATLADNDTKTDVEIEVNVKVPVNDKVTAVFKIDNANDDSDTTQTADSKGEVDIEDYYFQYVDGAVTVLAGQQNIPGRLTDGRQGDGVVALYNAGAFTIGAASFMNTNVTATTDGSANVNSVLAMGSAGPVSLSAQYVDANEVADSYNIKADTKVGPAKVGVEYSETDFDANNNEQSTFTAYASGSAGPVSAKLTYAKTGDQGSGSILQEAEAASEFLLWQLGSANKADFDVVALDATYKVSDKVALRVAFADGEEGSTDNTEILGQISYKMSKNLTTYVRYSELEIGNADAQTRARVEARYSF